MRDVKSSSNHNIKAIAFGVAVLLHGLAGAGLANMQIPELKPLKITPPIEITLINPVITETAVEHVQVSEPPKPITAPKVAKNPDPRPAAPAQARASNTPKSDTPKTKTNKTNTETSKSTQQNQQQKTPQTSQQQTPVTPTTPVISTNATPTTSNENKAPQQSPQGDSQVGNKNDKTGQSNKDDKNEKETNKIGTPNSGSKGADNGKNTDDGKDKGGGKNTGNEIGTITLTDSQVKASWKNKPNFDDVDHGNVKATTVSFTVHLEINEKGRITSATGVSTGLGKAIDKQITNAIKQASFKPFKDKNGNPVRGKATLPMNYALR